jgi:hypothetical protein
MVQSMSVNDWILVGYGLFLLIILVINLLYFFQVFQYRMPGDASLKVLFAHVILVMLVLIASTGLLGVIK